MPLYRFECDECGTQDTKQMTFEEFEVYKARHPRGHVSVHSGCVTGIFKQVYDFHFNRGMQEHYSDQLDMHVTSEAHFNSEMSRQQDEYQARTGLDAKFETIDPGDMAAAGATSEGLESQARALHDAESDGHRSIFT